MISSRHNRKKRAASLTAASRQPECVPNLKIAGVRPHARTSVVQSIQPRTQRNVVRDFWHPPARTNWAFNLDEPQSAAAGAGCEECDRDCVFIGR